MGDRRNALTFWLGNMGERKHFEDLVLDGMDIKMYHKEIKWEEVDWIDSGQNRNLWRALTNAVIKHQFT